MGTDCALVLVTSVPPLRPFSFNNLQIVQVSSIKYSLSLPVRLPKINANKCPEWSGLVIENIVQTIYINGFAVIHITVWNTG